MQSDLVVAVKSFDQQIAEVKSIREAAPPVDLDTFLADGRFQSEVSDICVQVISEADLVTESDLQKTLQSISWE